MSAVADVQVNLPADLADLGSVRSGLSAILNGVVSDPRQLAVRFEPASDGLFAIGVNGRPAVVGIRYAPDTDDEFVDEISARLLRRLPLWYAGLEDGDPYLADLGRDVRRLDAVDAAAAYDLTAAEPILDRPTASLTIEVPAAIARRIDADGLRAMTRLRATLFERTGVRLPNVDVVVTEPMLRRIRFGLNDVTVTIRHVPPDADWTDVIGYLARAIEPRMHWFLRMSEVEQALNDLFGLVPDLVHGARACYSTETLTATVRLLLQHGSNTRNLSRVLWLLLELGAGDSGADHLLMTEVPRLARLGDEEVSTDDPLLLMSRVRKCVAEEAWRVGLGFSWNRAGLLSDSVEQRLTAPMERVDPASAEWQAIGEYLEIGSPRVVVVRSVAAIRPVFAVLQALHQPPEVVAAHELPPDVTLDTIPTAHALTP